MRVGESRRSEELRTRLNKRIFLRNRRFAYSRPGAVSPCIRLSVYPAVKCPRQEIAETADAYNALLYFSP